MHYIDPYILRPVHKITVDVIGCGGNGSKMMGNLGMINSALKQLGKTELHVRAFDPDTVSHSNVGRQLFSSSDVGAYKSDLLITRINRFFGTNWESIPERFSESNEPSNITVSCVDTVKSRHEISNVLSVKGKQDHCRPIYWLDLGNGKDYGQIMLGSLSKASQPIKEGVGKLPTILEAHPEMTDTGDNSPSCSMAEALAHQDLFINSVMATFASHLLWKLFFDQKISFRGAYINMSTMNIQAIPV